MNLGGLTHKPNYSLAGIRAYLDLLKGLCLKNWAELGKPDGVALVGLLREKWDADLKAANGTAATAQRKAEAQGRELERINRVLAETKANLARTTNERELAKALLKTAGYYNAYLAVVHAMPAGQPPVRDERPHRNTEFPQTNETHGD